MIPPGVVAGGSGAAALDPYATVVTGLPGLVAYWRLGDAGTAVLADASGHGHDGNYPAPPVAFGAPRLTWDAADGRATNFGGAGFGEVPHHPAFALPRGTLSFYFKATAGAIAGEHGLLGKDIAGATTPPDQMTVRLLSDGGLRCFFQRGGSTMTLDTQTGVIEPGMEYHVIVMWDQIAIWLLLDGRVVAWSREHTTGLSGNDLPWRFGIRTFDNLPADVTLDEVALYDRRLSWSELDALSEHIRGLPYDPTPQSSEVVSTAAELKSAMAAAGPGHHILVASDTYDMSGTFTLTNSGAKRRPIVVRPQGGAVTLTNLRMDLRNRWFVLDGFNVPNSRIRAQGSDCRFWRITRCSNASIGNRFLNVMGMFGRMDHCDLSNITEETGMGIVLDVDDKNNDPAGFPTRAACYNLIDHNYFHDTSQMTSGANEAINFGTNRQDSEFAIYSMSYRNLFARWLADAEVITIKSKGNLCIGCTVIDSNHSGTTRYGNRHGAQAWYEGEWYQNIGFTRHLNRDNVLIGCRWIDARCEVWFGDTEASVFASSPDIGNYPNAIDTLLVGCVAGSGAEFRIGGGFSAGDRTVAPTGTALHDCSGTRNEANGASVAIDDAIAPVPYTAAAKLTTANVGPQAPDPLVPEGLR